MGITVAKSSDKKKLFKRINVSSLPSEIRIQPPNSLKYFKTRAHINHLKLNTVCEEAKCPNINECWSTGTATIMILGNQCTRFCKFCNVKTGNPQGVVDNHEPFRVADQIYKSGLNYVVITCVDRDDLEDGGVKIFSQTIEQIRLKNKGIKIEALTSDYQGKPNLIDILMDSPPDVFAHNLEVVERITSDIRDPRANYRQSLRVLNYVKKNKPSVLTKTSLMVGMGETLDEIKQTFIDIKNSNIDIVTIGQYLRPSKKHYPVLKYYTPKEFKFIEDYCRSLGFLYVASGALVRSSYRAGELFIKKHLAQK